MGHLVPKEGCDKVLRSNTEQYRRPDIKDGSSRFWRAWLIRLLEKEKKRAQAEASEAFGTRGVTASDLLAALVVKCAQLPWEAAGQGAKSCSR